MILIDTTPLVALCDNRDRLHARAVKDLTSLAHEEFALCEAVLTEACFHLSHQSQRRRMRMLLDEGVMICTGGGTAASTIGRQHTKRQMPW